MVRLLSQSGVPTEWTNRSADAIICRSPADRGSMTGAPGDMTETPDRGRFGCIIRRLEGGAFNRRRVLARRVLRALVHCGALRARTLRAPALGPASYHVIVCHCVPRGCFSSAMGKVEMWRGGCRLNISVAASFVWRCLSGSAMAPFPHPAHRTGHADLPHPALGPDFTPSPTARRAQAGTDVRARSARKGARVDKLRPCVA